MRLALLFLLFLVAAAGCILTEEGPPGPTAPLPPCDWAKVQRVVDGDTVVVRLGGSEERVRYIGIDTPETVAPGRPVEPFGPEASERNRALLGGGWVCLEKDVSERDRFGRLLRHPWLPDGALLSEALVAEGLAVVVTFPPDVKYHESRFLPAQEAARASGVGIWE